jgi:hypothetical protein
MYRITSKTPDGNASGQWRVAEGDSHAPVKGDNPNLFFPTLRQARAKVRELNK